MDKRIELINYCLEKNYKYSETSKEIEINRIVDELNNIDESISYDKDLKELMLWLEDNGSGKAHTLNEIELNIVIMIKNLMLGE